MKIELDVLADVIDPDFWGDVKVILQNHGESLFEVRRGDHIAKGILETALFPQFKETEPDKTDRGNVGFGEAARSLKIEERKGEEPTIYPDLAYAQQNDPALAETFLQGIPEAEGLDMGSPFFSP